nr:Uncharacterised protein [Streptococcus thermophilus]
MSACAEIVNIVDPSPARNRSTSMCQYSCATATSAVVTATMRRPVMYTLREPSLSTSHPAPGAPTNRAPENTETTRSRSRHRDAEAHRELRDDRRNEPIPERDEERGGDKNPDLLGDLGQRVFSEASEASEAIGGIGSCARRMFRVSRGAHGVFEPTAPGRFWGFGSSMPRSSRKSGGPGFS